MKTLKQWRIPLLIIIDCVLINAAYILSLCFRFSFSIPKEYLGSYKNGILIILLVYSLIFILSGMYKSLWIYAGTDEFLVAIAGGAAAGLLTGTITTIFENPLPLSVQILATVLSTMFVCGFRICFRVYRRFSKKLERADKSQVKKVMIVGAGSAGALLIREMKLNKQMNYKPMALIDDNFYKLGTTISGVKVYGSRKNIEETARKLEVDTIIIAIPTLDNENKKHLVDICKKTGCQVKIAPGVSELINEKHLLNKIRDVEVEDLLGRDTIKLNVEGISSYIENNIVLVTGGGGSIGSELCRQITRFNPKQLLILDIYENNVYDLQNELKYKYPDLNMKVIIASVRDRQRLESIFKQYRPEVVFHAAAHKHVPLMEDNPSEAIKNNVFGTLNLSECADRYDVKRFVMISTDKAVNPTNIMGATKRICEMIVQAMDKISKTEFVAVRFGNVLGSNGSVIPLFKKQIANGGPVTLTHKEITRFFMTIPEAAQLVLQAGAFAKGGEIFVLDMGKPVKIYDLACDLIKLSGLEPEKDIKIEVTGLRPGEKLYEELLMSEEGLGETRHEKIFVGSPMSWDIEKLKDKLEGLRFLIDSDNREEMVGMVQEIVPTYRRMAIDEVAAVKAN